MNIIGKAIWRSPSQTDIYYLESGIGDDEFIIAPYQKNGSVQILKGQIKPLTETTAPNLFHSFQLAECPIVISTTETHYLEMVNKAVETMQSKQFEKVVLARQLLVESALPVEKIFHALTKAYPNAFVYCFSLNNGLAMIGATPETLLERKADSLTTQALGGTEQSYGYTEKEYLEHQQIIEDIRSKLKSQHYTFEIGTTHPKKAGNVSHLSTPISIVPQSLESDLNLIKQLHPTAAIGGLPYESANAFIASNEDFDRHYYAGYLGFKQNEAFSFYVNLRCAELYKNGAILFAGAGINSNSIAADEWQETNNKLNTLRPYFN